MQVGHGSIFLADASLCERREVFAATDQRRHVSAWRVGSSDCEVLDPGGVGPEVAGRRGSTMPPVRGRSRPARRCAGLRPARRTVTNTEGTAPPRALRRRAPRRAPSPGAPFSHMVFGRACGGHKVAQAGPAPITPFDQIAEGGQLVSDPPAVRRCAGRQPPRRWATDVGWRWARPLVRASRGSCHRGRPFSQHGFSRIRPGRGGLGLAQLKQWHEDRPGQSIWDEGRACPRSTSLLGPAISRIAIALCLVGRSATHGER